MDASQSIPIIIPEKLRSSVSPKFTQRYFMGSMKFTHKIKDFAGPGSEADFPWGAKGKRKKAG
jgi:hypothetical protein